jgi:hypothetical protein
MRRRRSFERLPAGTANAATERPHSAVAEGFKRYAHAGQDINGMCRYAIAAALVAWEACTFQHDHLSTGARQVMRGG